MRTMKDELPPLADVLAKLPWFYDLTSVNRSRLLDEVTERLVINSTREEFESVLDRWSLTAHVDAKWSRLEVLRESGLLAS